MSINRSVGLHLPHCRAEAQADDFLWLDKAAAGLIESILFHGPKAMLQHVLAEGPGAAALGQQIAAAFVQSEQLVDTRATPITGLVTESTPPALAKASALERPELQLERLPES